MFLNNKLPPGLLNLYKQQNPLQIKSEEVPPNKEIVDVDNQKQQQQTKPPEESKKEIEKSEKENSKKDRLQLTQIQNSVFKKSTPIQAGNSLNQKRKNPFVKDFEKSDTSGRKFFEYIEPEVRKKQLQEGLQNSFIYMAVGPPKSGKTRLIGKLLNDGNYYGSHTENKSDNFFQKQIFISPSILPGFKLCEGYNYLKNIDLFLLYNMLDVMDREYAEEEEFKQNNVKGHLLLVFDDCIGEMQGLQKKKEFQNLFNNRRQILISLDIEILISSQNAVGVPAFIRKISTGLFLFQVLGGQEYKTIIEENIPKKYSDIFRSVVVEYTKEQCSCILIQRYPFAVFASVNNFQKITLL